MPNEPIVILTQIVIIRVPNHLSQGVLSLLAVLHGYIFHKVKEPSTSLHGSSGRLVVLEQRLHILCDRGILVGLKSDLKLLCVIGSVYSVHS